MADYGVIFTPLIALFNEAQITALFMAWLPTKLETYLTGVMAVDMFLTCACATGLTALLGAMYQFGHYFFTSKATSKNKTVTVQIEHNTIGKWGCQYTSEFYEALSWLISGQTMDLEEGQFIVQKPTKDQGDEDPDLCKPPEFNILPEKNQKISIDYKERKFEVSYECPEEEGSDESGGSRRAKKSKPSIFLSTIEDSTTTVKSVWEFIENVTRAHLEHLKSKRVRGRFERDGDYWDRIQSLGPSRGLDTVALDEPQEMLVKKELETFIKDKDFYARIGMPYRRGILLYGKPGTGKTSLINAISAELNRDIYYINLKGFQKENPDSELSAAFSSVPANQIIVLEDVDTQSKVLHKRSRQKSFDLFDLKDDDDDDKPIVSAGFGPTFSLSTFLSCLDGQILAEGIIIIMTTNYIDHLDPAVIRPGRMDLQLDLGYCTHYQIKKMFQSVCEDKDLRFPQDGLDQIPEHFLPPCEVMSNMLLYRNEPSVIPNKLVSLIDKVKNDNERREQERLEKARKNEEKKKKKETEQTEGKEAINKTEGEETINKTEGEETINKTEGEETINTEEVATEAVDSAPEDESTLTIEPIAPTIIDKSDNEDAQSSDSLTDVEEENKVVSEKADVIKINQSKTEDVGWVS